MDAGAMDTDGTTYRERLWPTWWACLLALGLPAMLAVAYGAALGASVGWLVGALGLVFVVLVLYVTAPHVEVSPAGLAVDRALLPVRAVASAEVVDAEQIARLRGPGADARVFVALRPWSCREGVLVTLDDADDPHPAWLFSSRHPGRVVAALTATMGR